MLPGVGNVECSWRGWSGGDPALSDDVMRLFEMTLSKLDILTDGDNKVSSTAAARLCLNNIN